MKKGFTLVELLAVIVILAVVALIATPTIMKMVDESKEKAAIQSVNGILEAGNNYVVDEALSQNPKTKITLDLKNTDLEYKGTKPEKGTLLIKDGKMSVIAKIGKYCVEKKFNEESPKIIESETCEIEESQTLKYEDIIALNTSGNDCVTDSTKTCTKEEIINGLSVDVYVNEDEKYTFYVLSDNGNTVNLLSNKDLNQKTAWASKSDYLTVSKTECSYNFGCNDYGPITAMKTITELTKNWDNIPNLSGTRKYKNNTFDLSKYKARMAEYNEIVALNCKMYTGTTETANTCPVWAQGDYWLMSTSWSDENGGTANTVSPGSWNTGYVAYGGLVRPVITISKSQIR